ncbi:uncharacterized protein LOC144453684 [Glandiceps talaboti]
MKCNDCGQTRGVHLCQGGLDLCKKCAAKRFPQASSSTPQDKAKMADKEDGNDLSQIMSHLAALNEKVDKIPTLANKIDDLQASVEYISSFFDMYKERMDRMEEDNKTLKDQLASATAKVTTMDRELQDLQQYTRRNNLEIHGIQEQPGEDTDALVMKVATAAGIRISQTDIDVSHRLPSRRQCSNTKPSTIIVRFTRRTVRSNIYNARKNIKNKSTRDMNIDNNDQNRVYINENLSPTNKQIFYKANERKKMKKWKFIWTNKGKIFVKKSEEERAIMISSEGDIEQMI